MSWGGSEFSGETATTAPISSHAGVAFVASVGRLRRAGVVAGGFTERAGGRRHDAYSGATTPGRARPAGATAAADQAPTSHSRHTRRAW